jgi:hypothetical protein
VLFLLFLLHILLQSVQILSGIRAFSNPQPETLDLDPKITHFATEMAIYSAVPPPPESPTTTASATAYQPGHQSAPSLSSSVASLDIEAWTVSALQSLTISPLARGTGGTPLGIPLDAHDHNGAAGAEREGQQRVTLDVAAGGGMGITPPRRPPSRRDSQRKREMLLKGKEGSRQRRRWENGEQRGVSAFLQVLGHP